MRVTCHRSSVQQRYCSGVLTLSHIVSVVLWLTAAFLPLLLAYGSRDFLLEVNSYREQPVVGLTDQVLCILEGEWDNGGQKHSLTLVHTTVPEWNQQLYSNETLRSAFVKTSTRDDNADGVPELVHVEISTPLSTNETIRQATVVVVLDYTLKVHLYDYRYVKLNMDVLVMLRHSSLLAGDELLADGDLDFRQRSPFEVTDSTQQPYIDSPIVNMTNTTQELLVQSLVSEYRERNYTANFDAPYPIWMSNSNSPEDIRVFRAVMDIRIGAINVIYTPAWPEIVKHAWIQYYSIFVVVSTIAIYLREYLFVTKILPSVSVIDEPRQKFTTKYD